MKVLGIAASPRRNGNSEILLDKVLEGASSKGAGIEKIVLNELDIKPCQGCLNCLKKAKCVTRDDMQRLYPKLKRADAVVVASPVYFGSVTAQLKTMIDRCQPIWIENFILKRKKRRKRKGIFISVSGRGNPRFFRNSKEVVEVFFYVLGISPVKHLYLPNLKYPGEVLTMRPLLQKAFRYGADMVK